MEEEKIKELIRKVIEEEVNVITSRWDLKTRLCMMAASIHSTAPEGTDVKEAIQAAVAIENAANAAVKKMKQDNPIPRAARGVVVRSN
jgi:hypothetical protein